MKKLEKYFAWIEAKRAEKAAAARLVLATAPAK